MKKRRSIKNILVVFILLTTIYIGYSIRINTKISRDLEIKIPFTLKIVYNDTHGGFHGDGTTLAKAKLTHKDINSIVKKSKRDWRLLPFTEKVDTTLYGEENNAIYYGNGLGRDLNMPKIEKGYWILLDRSHNEKNFIEDDDSDHWSTSNFSIGIIDIDRNMFYYIKYDV